MNEYHTINDMQAQDMQDKLYRTQTPQQQARPLTDGQYLMEDEHPMAEQQEGVCPFCGSVLPPGADYCENCRKYIREDVCSFCGAAMISEGAYCPECGSPKGGLVCPECHTLNEFAFCKKCGYPLTPGAMEQAEYLRSTPEFKRLQALTTEMSRLDNVEPFSSDTDQENTTANERLRIRVLRMLAEDKGEQAPELTPRKSERMTAMQLETKKMDLARLISEALGELAAKPQPSPVKTRNYAMAMKPAGVRLAWVCNYKHAMHSGPCGCAKPQLGGRWVILGHKDSGLNTTTKDK